MDRGRLRRSRAGRRRGLPIARAEGVTLVALVVFVAVLNVMVAVALPLWTQQIKREKEEELIFRGLQYAEAIRIFQERTGRYPVRLEELLEVQPRSIRQLWKDPMTEDGKWDLILEQGLNAPGDPDDGRTVGGPGAPSQDRDSRRRRGRSTSREGETVTIGPIAGVRSKSEEKAVKSFAGGDTYNSWLFMPDMIPIAPTAPGELIPSLNSRWVGRPFPDGVEPLEGMGLDDEFGDDDDDEEEDRGSRRRQRRDRRERRQQGGGEEDG